jgi:hypothetical protein
VNERLAEIAYRGEADAERYQQCLNELHEVVAEHNRCRVNPYRLRDYQGFDDCAVVLNGIKDRLREARARGACASQEVPTAIGPTDVRPIDPSSVDLGGIWMMNSRVPVRFARVGDTSYEVTARSGNCHNCGQIGEGVAYVTSSGLALTVDWATGMHTRATLQPRSGGWIGTCNDVDQRGSRKTNRCELTR